MPRISRPAAVQSRPTKTLPPAKKNSKKRVLDAFAIASHQVTDTPKIRRSRLGQTEDDPRDRKRRRPAAQDSEDDDVEDEDEDAAPKRRKRRASVGDSEEGSDSEGNNWTLGHVDKDDDSDIDSDEAFSEGDEERFSHFTFRGSSKNKSQTRGGQASGYKSTRKSGGHGLDEQDEEEEGSDDSLGEDAIDLAQMLDDYEEDEEMADAGAGSDDEAHEADQPAHTDSDDSNDSDDSDGSGSEEDDVFSYSSMDDEHEQDPKKIGRLQNLVSSLHPKTAQEKQHAVSSYESMTPSVAGILNSEKFDIRDILESTGDAQLAKTSKTIGIIPSKAMKKDLKLAPSLPQRQKEKLDRIAANEQAKETLDRWKDSVKQMRRAEHLTFPLQDPEHKPAHDTGYLLPSITTKPVTDLESTISNILRESGLAADDPASDEFDDLPDNQVSVQEIMAKRADLRRARDLIFREEQRSKRVKKIKSKAYRRVHRKEREKLAALDRDAFDQDFGAMNDSEREEHDRKRAQERMGAKHRDSKWAKQMKKSGRSIWDEDARSGVTEMAKRNEELRRRMEGKDVGDDGSSSSDEDGPSDEDEPTFQLRQLRKKISKLKDEDVAANEEESGLASMKFMKRAEESRRKQNEDDINRMVKEMNGEDSDQDSSIDEAETIGRKLFGPNSNKPAVVRPVQQRGEFEEQEDSAAEDNNDDLEMDSMPIVDPSAILPKPASSTKKPLDQTSNQPPSNKPSNPAASTNSKPNSQSSKPSKPSTKPDAEGWITVSYTNDSDSPSDAESTISQSSILRRAFAGDDVEADFLAEKRTTTASESTKILDTTLPGWGSWIGENVSARERAKSRGRRFTTVRGVAPEKRADFKKKDVIMSTKRSKKNVGYMASSLPFPFTSREEYDKSIRMPIGKEWNVKRSVGESIKPRVIVKPGQIVAPMEKPLI